MAKKEPLWNDGRGVVRPAGEPMAPPKEGVLSEEERQPQVAVTFEDLLDDAGGPGIVRSR